MAEIFDVQIDPRMIWAAMAFGRSFLGFGTSSDICVTASGVPIVKAPFRTPAKKANPLGQPVLFAQSDQTKAFEACVFGIAAMTIMVVRPPTSTTNSPNCCRYGRYLLKNIVAAIQIQVIKRSVTKICQG
jgi:hypothetical protein